MTYPVLKLQRATENVTAGSLAVKLDQDLLLRRDEIGNLSRSIAFMTSRIDHLMRSQRDFLAQVSHELGSPLTRMNLALALAQRKATPELSPELTRMKSEARDLNLLIHQLLLLARLENTSELNNRTELFSLAELTDEVVAAADFEARQSHKVLRVCYTDGARWAAAMLRGNRDLMKRAFDNVLRNAIRYTPDGSAVDIKCASLPGQQIKLQIRDYGSGVPNEKLSSIFEPFVRLASNQKENGFGLGLAIAKRAIDYHQGTLWAANVKPGGLSITIQLPVVFADTPAELERDRLTSNASV